MRKLLACLTVAALASVMLAACGGDDDDSSNAKGDSTSKTTAKASSDDSSGSSDTTDVTTGNKKYDELIAKAKNTPYRVTYKSSDSNDEFTIVNDPPKSAFITGDSRMVRDGDKTVSCSGSGDSEQCVEMPATGVGLESLMTGFFGAYASFLSADENNNPFLDVSSTDDETIAGRDAACAKIEAGKLAGTAGSIKVCIDKETGVLLLGETESSGDKNSIEATDVGEPKDSDFEIPDNATKLTLPSDGSQ